MKSRKVKAYNARKNNRADLKLEDSDDSNIDPDSFYHDEIDDFNDKKDNELSTDDELIQQKRDSSEEEEVLPITDDEKDDSDDEEQDEDESDDEDDLPNREAWGRKKSSYYSADFVDQDRGRTYREEDAEAAKAEEEEALAIQRSLYSNINTDNLGAHLFFESGEESPEEEEIDKDSATKDEYIRYLKKETKYFEYKALWELANQKCIKLLKFSKLMEAGVIEPSETLEQYISVKKQIYYLIIHNIHVYYLFFFSGKNPKHHPVNQRIAEFKKYLDEIETKDQAVLQGIDEILGKVSRGEINIVNDSVSPSISKDSTEIANEDKKIKKRKAENVETENEKEVASLKDASKEKLKKIKLQELNKNADAEQHDDCDDELTADQDENTDDKRVISYQIAKNKGLVPHRKKEYRNPRVRHRMKFRKAEIRRKGQVRNVVKEIKRYEGEATGINAYVVKSRKFKH